MVNKENEIGNLQRSINQLESGRQKLVNAAEEADRLRSKNHELVSKVSEYEQTIFSSSSELDGLRSKLQFSEDKIKRLNEIENREAQALR